jgi:hypothetical protein
MWENVSLVVIRIVFKSYKSVDQINLKNNNLNIIFIKNI